MGKVGRFVQDKDAPLERDPIYGEARFLHAVYVFNKGSKTQVIDYTLNQPTHMRTLWLEKDGRGAWHARWASPS